MRNILNVSLTLSLLLALPLMGAGTAQARQSTPRPTDWISHMIPMRDSREKPDKTALKEKCKMEIVELAYSGGGKPRAAVMLIPGFFQDGFAFDVLPEQGVSFARYLMNAKHLKVYLLHVRGINASCYLDKSNLDELAIDDIPNALEYLNDLEHDKVLAVGHSQGGITLQASLAGLTRCGGKEVCFDEQVARERQRLVSGAAYLGSDPTLQSKGDKALGHMTHAFELALSIPPGLFVDRIPAVWLTKYVSPSWLGPLSFEKSKMWDMTYLKENVSDEVRNKFYNAVLESSTRGIVFQYTNAIQKNGIESGSGDLYADQLGNIKVPSVMTAYQFDSFADPTQVKDLYGRLGSRDKRHYYFKNQGHQDFMLNRQMHYDASGWVDWLLANRWR